MPSSGAANDSTVTHGLTVFDSLTAYGLHRKPAEKVPKCPPRSVRNSIALSSGVYYDSAGSVGMADAIYPNSTHHNSRSQTAPEKSRTYSIITSTYEFGRFTHCLGKTSRMIHQNPVCSFCKTKTLWVQTTQLLPFSSPPAWASQRVELPPPRPSAQPPRCGRIAQAVIGRSKSLHSYFSHMFFPKQCGHTEGLLR